PRFSSSSAASGRWIGGNGAWNLVISHGCAGTSQSPTGSLTITKAVTGAGSDYTGTFTFSVTCTAPAWSQTGIRIDTASGDTAQVTGIRLNDQGSNSCTVTETGSSSPPSGYQPWTTTYSWGSTTGSATGGPITLTSDGASVTVTNTTSQSPTGSLTITKAVTGAGSDYTGTFTFSVTCTAPAWSQTGIRIDTASGDTAQVTGIRLNDQGSNSCTVTETGSSSPPSGYQPWTTTYSWGSTTGSATGGPITLTSDGASVTVTNTTSYTPPPPPSPGEGYFQFSKTVTGNLTGWTGGSFPFTVTCSGVESTLLDPTVSVNLPVPSSGGPVTSALYGPYPEGTTCSVVEGTLPSAGTYASWVTSPTYSPVSGSQTIVSGETVSVAVTNTRTYSPPPPPPTPAYGSFQFSKTVTGNLTGWTGGTFPFTVTCGGSSQTVNLTVNDSGDAVSSQTFGPYVAGTTCSVVEGALPAAGTNANWANSPHYSPSGGSVTILANQTVSVSVLNTRTYSPATTPPSPKPTGGVAGATGTPKPTPGGAVAGATGTPEPTLPATTEVPGQGGALNGTILLLLGLLGAGSLALITLTLLRERLLDSVEK
ncbi:MAG: hypothetical protein ACP5VP_09695, partial [Candidatus Limnocylindrales bacterium]